MTQLTASQILGVDEMTLCNWENKRSNPMLHLLPKLIEFLGYDPMIVKTKTVGERILQYRKSRGITQKELARQIGIDPPTLSRLGREKKGVFPHILEKVSSFLTAHVLDGGVVKR
ncbi:MAG: helix-turn-helix transcriptional regulator [Ignavibacteriales bacterium]|nr:helix-turn-helix transcriptional regulator [Ignavibacteriales bacterium]